MPIRDSPRLRSLKSQYSGRRQFLPRCCLPTGEEGKGERPWLENGVADLLLAVGISAVVLVALADLLARQSAPPVSVDVTSVQRSNVSRQTRLGSIGDAPRRCHPGTSDKRRVPADGPPEPCDGSAWR